MKKIFIVALAIFTTTQLLAQSGRVKVTFLGFKCYRETWDDILGLDGRGDELLFKFNISTSDKNGNTKIMYDRTTDVYGDKSGSFTNRIKAGTESPTGGVRAGDLVNTNLLLGEYDLANGDFVSIIPTAWEQDPIADNMNSFTNTFGAVVSDMNKSLSTAMIGINIASGNFIGALFHGAMLKISSIKPAGDQGELGKAGTRPIGMKKYGEYTPEVVAVNTANLTTLCNSNYGWGNGVIEVKYDEVALGNTRDHGIYSILLKFEFTPNNSGAPAPAPGSTTISKNNAAPAPSAGSSNNNTVISNPKNVQLGNSRQLTTTKTISANNNIAANSGITRLPAAGTTPPPHVTGDQAAGLWRGTLQTAGISGTAPLNVKLDGNTFWVLKNDGSMGVTAAGAYSVKNGVMTGNYFFENISYTYTSTGFNQSTGEMSGTWSGGGKSGTWIMKKIGA